MSIAIGSDHAGYPLKIKVVQYLKEQNIKLKDMGTFSKDRVDYPDYALKVAKAVVSGQSEKGIVICGTGIGVSIMANKIKGIRAALCCSEYMATMARQHNNANILAMGGRTTSIENARKIVDTFLNTDFAGGQHALRVEKIHKLSTK
jgi:ribose 5-phosphate isomerase B